MPITSRWLSVIAMIVTTVCVALASYSQGRVAAWGECDALISEASQPIPAAHSCVTPDGSTAYTCAGTN
jgi:hypothetical protein